MILMRLAPYASPVRVDIQTRGDGTLILTNPHPLRAAFANVVAPLEHWAIHAPNRLWLAGFEGGAWRHLSYDEGWTLVQSLAAGLYERFARGTIIAIASGNSITHALLTYAAAMAGLAVAPITPAYATKARDSRRLVQALETVKASAVFMEGLAFARPALWAEEAGVTVISPGDGFGTAGEISLDSLFGASASAPDHMTLDPNDACKYGYTTVSMSIPSGVFTRTSFWVTPSSRYPTKVNWSSFPRPVGTTAEAWFSIVKNEKFSLRIVNVLLAFGTKNMFV